MVLESITNPFIAEHNPGRMFFYGFLISTLAFLLAFWIFGKQSSLIVVFLTTLACVPLVHATIKMEEQKDEAMLSESKLLKEHGRALSFFIFLFLGMVVSSVVWYVVLPENVVQDLFSVQTGTISGVNATPTGNAVGIDRFLTILSNNLRVTLFCILFAFIYGVGAIFILAWNASVIGAAIGNFIRTELARISTEVGLTKLGSYFSIWSIGLLKYSIHGIPEIFAYFTAGLGAGIISVAILRHGLEVDKFKHVLIDAMDLILISIVTIILAAFLEVYVTPLVF